MEDTYNSRYYAEATNEDGEVVYIPRKFTEAGIFLDMPIDVYHSQEAVSCSGIKQLLKSPYHYWSGSPLNANKQPFKTTSSMIKGQKFHKYLLERKTFFDDYKIKAKVQTSNVAGMVGEGELLEIKEAISTITQLMPKVAKICLEGARTEVSIFWVDEETGILCRCRHDIFKPHISTDYKTANDVTPRDCTGSLVNYDYILQAAFYLDGNKAFFKNHCTQQDMEKLGITEDDRQKIIEHSNFVFFFQEPKPPFSCWATTIEDNLLQKGRENINTALITYRNNKNLFGNEPWAAWGDEVKATGVDELDFFGKGWYMHKEY